MLAVARGSKTARARDTRWAPRAEYNARSSDGSTNSSASRQYSFAAYSASRFSSVETWPTAANATSESDANCSRSAETDCDVSCVSCHPKRRVTWRMSVRSSQSVDRPTRSSGTRRPPSHRLDLQGAERAGADGGFAAACTREQQPLDLGDSRRHEHRHKHRHRPRRHGCLQQPFGPPVPSSAHLCLPRDTAPSRAGPQRSARSANAW